MPFDDVAFLVPRLTLGGLGLLRERFPRPARVRVLLPVRALPKGAPGPLRYTLLDTTPAELVLDNQLAQGAEAQRVRRWLGAETIEVRTVRAEASLPGMAWVGGALVVGNPELTRECLDPTRPMAEAGLFAPDAASRDALVAVFERLWAQGQDCKQALRDRLDAYRPVAPRFLYYLTLWHLFRDRLPEWRGVFSGDVSLGETPIWKSLYPFQRHGAMAILRKLKTDGGCILADSVGLGKTYTALAVVKAYERMGRGRILVLCPKKLRSNWMRFLRDEANAFTDVNGRPDFYYHVLNHTDLGRKRFDTGHGEVEAERFWPRGFSLIVIDESHNFRNPGGKRYSFLLDHLKAHSSTHLLLLTATPVSNRLADLTGQLALIRREDPNVPSRDFRRAVVAPINAAQRRVRDYVKAHADDPATFSAATMAGLLGEGYFKLLTRTTIARSRAGIRQFYASIAEALRMPQCDFAEARPGLDTANGDLDVEVLSERLLDLTLASYTPTDEAFLRPGIDWVNKGAFNAEHRQRSLVALMRINLLKRLESSIASFRKTLEEVLIARTRAQLRDLDLGRVRVPLSTARDFLGAENADALARTAAGVPDGDALGEEEGEVSERLAKEVTLVAREWVDVKVLRRALKADLDIAEKLLARAQAVTSVRDAKLQALGTALETKCRRPINPGNAKALIFTAFADTADYVAEALARRFPNRAIACVTGSDCRVWRDGRATGASMSAVLRRFAPGGQEVPEAERAWLEPIDWVVATDCLSEGQNLQDCDFVVNYDIHWNPLRLVQRIGRVNRIGSPNAHVRALLFWPCAQLDGYIGLERRVRMKNAVAATAAAGAGTLSTETQQDLAYRQQQLLSIQRGRLDLDTFVGGGRNVVFDDFLGDLDAWLQVGNNAKRCAAAPLGLCAVTPGELTDAFVGEPLPPLPSKGGVLFLLRRAGMDAAERATNPLGDCFLLAVDAEGCPLTAPAADFTPADDEAAAPAADGVAPGVLVPLPPERALALLRALCRDRDETVPKLDAWLVKRPATAFTNPLRGALALLRIVRETNRVRLLLGDIPFDFHTGLTDDLAALTLLTFALILPQNKSE